MNKSVHKLTPSHITYKLSLLVSLLVIVTFISYEAYKFLKAKAEITQDINTEQFAQAQFIAKDIKDKIDKRTQFISALSDIIALEKDLSEKRLVEILETHLRLTNTFPQGFAVMPPDGLGTLAEYPVIPGRKNYSFANSTWFIQAKKTSEVVIGTPFISKINGKLIMPIGKTIEDKQGNILAVLAAPIFLNSPGFMGYVFDKNHRKQGQVLVISRTDEIFIASGRPDFVLSPTPKPGMNRFHDAVMGGFNGYDHSVTNDGSTMLTAAADINGPDWFVVLRTPFDKAYKSINEKFYSSIIHIIFLGLVVLFVITFTMYLFFKPLRRSARAMAEMVDKSKPLSQIEIYKNDEIGGLISGFNSLISMVEERNSNLENANAMLASLSQTDGLTGVSNRRYFDATYTKDWKVQQRSQKPITIILIDIDYFKKYNDTYGHIAGDDCLKHVAMALQKTINRPTDFFARYGGEEFVLLLHGDVEEGEKIAEKARKAIINLQLESRYSSFKCVTVSLGVASIIPQLEMDPMKLIDNADQALYESKANGRNRYTTFVNPS